MSDSSSPPLKVPNYIIEKKIGSGAYGDVYKAYKKLENGKVEPVAIKAVRRTSTKSVESLITEIKLLLKLKHRHIVQLIDFQCDEHYIYILMELCAGGDLSHFVKSRHRLPESECQRFLQQIASALKYMREKNISHFDLKPQNILISSRKQPVLKIGDFGLAQNLPESESTSKIKGSPLYMAPEIILKKNYSAKVDLWSVGVILYECLFGKPPYSSQTFDELVKKIKTDTQIKVPFNSSVSASCHDLLTRCLQRDPAKRIDFEEFFNHPFVDLEHKPSPENLEKARSLLNEAVAFDEKESYDEALLLYTESLAYLIPAVKDETDVSKKIAMRQYVKQYLERTEKIKRLLSTNVTVLPNESIERENVPMVHLESANSAVDPIEELKILAASTPPIITYIDIARSGELYEMEANFVIALEKYETALGKLIELLQNEPKGRRKELLVQVINKWMTRAEYIKGLLSTTAEEVVEETKEEVKTTRPKKGMLKKHFDRISSSFDKDDAGSSSMSSNDLMAAGLVSSAAVTSKALSEAEYEKHCGLM